MTKTYAPFDAAAYLDNDEVIAEYLTAAAEDPNPEVFLAALHALGVKFAVVTSADDSPQPR